MSKLGYRARFVGSETTVEMELSLLRFKEDDIVFIYSPALDLTGYGKDGTSARRSFQLTLTEFVRYATNKGSLHSELKKLGWKVGGTKSRPRFDEPLLDELFQARPYLTEIIREKDFHRYTESVSLAA